MCKILFLILGKDRCVSESTGVRHFASLACLLACLLASTLHTPRQITSPFAWGIIVQTDRHESHFVRHRQSTSSSAPIHSRLPLPRVTATSRRAFVLLHSPTRYHATPKFVRPISPDEVSLQTRRVSLGTTHHKADTSQLYSASRFYCSTTTHRPCFAQRKEG